MNAATKNILKKSLDENGFEVELRKSIEHFDALREAVEMYLSAYTHEDRTKQLFAIELVRNKMSDIQISLNLLRLLFGKVDRETSQKLQLMAERIENPIGERKSCFAYSPNGCLVLTKTVCKNQSCSFFKTKEQYEFEYSGGEK